MLPEISLTVLDIVSNSITAGASNVSILIGADRATDRLTFTVEDDGRGMTKEQLERATDPFYTTRTTRDIGLGLPFLKQEALMTGGDFSISSEPGKGTSLTAVFGLSHIDRMPLGNITETIHQLIIYNENVRFLYTYRFDSKEFTLDTAEIREILGDVSFKEPEVSGFILAFLEEHKQDVDNGEYI